MKPVRLHHVGIIMTTMERAQQFMEQFGLEEDYREYVDAYQAWCIFTKYSAEESPVELVVPTAGKLTEFNKGKGGLHHIAFEVEDVRAARDEYTAKGMEMLEEVPAKGAGGIIVNFLRPRYGLGVLVEFVEKTDK
ncbi:MAG: VOC family protein [Ruminococcus sp.]|nr:VOC family protein [Ruminococcus sp.]